MQHSRRQLIGGSPWDFSPIAEGLESRLLPSANAFAAATDHDVATDRSGNLYVAYFDGAAKKLKFTERTAGGAWVAPVAVAPLVADAGGQISLAVTTGGSPAIAYYDAGDAHLKYAHMVRGSWRVTTLDAAVTGGTLPSLAIRPDGTPLVTYYSPAARQLRLASADTSGAWKVSILSGKTAAAVSKATIDPASGTPRIIYQLRTGQIYACQLVNGNLTAPVLLDASRTAPSTLSASYGTDGLLGLAFFDPTTGQLKLIRARPHGRFSVMPVVTGLSTDPNSSLAFDPQTGLPEVSYLVPQQSSLYLAGMASATASFTTRLLAADASGAGKLVALAKGGSTLGYSALELRDGSASLHVNTSSVTPLPPSGVTATGASPNEIDLSWTNTSTSQVSIRIERSTDGVHFAPVTQLAGGASQYADASLAPATAYYYRVIAVGADGSEAAAVVNPASRGGSPIVATASTQPVANAPQAPANLVATGVSDTEVNLTWDRTGTGETGITVWRSDSNGPWQVVSTQPAGSNIWTDTSCYPGRTYSYRVTADNAAGSSPASNTVAATTIASGATLATATTVIPAATSPYTVTVSWNDPLSGYHNWLVERSSDGVSFSVVSVVPGSGSTGSYTDTSLNPGVTYYYRLRGASGAGYSDYTPIVSIPTPSRPDGVPLMPSHLTATVNSANSTTLTWTDTNGGAASYLIETAPFSWTGTPTWTQIGQTAVGATSYNLTTTAETFYYVRIRAANAAGNGGYTPQVVFRTASPGTGSAKTYTVGPGKQYGSLAALDWSKLGPGDTVLIYPNKDANGNVIPYYEKPLISVRGTSTAPITIKGVADPITGQLPILDGTHATSVPGQWASHYQPLEDLSLLLIGTRADNNGGGWSPGYLAIQGLELRNGYVGDAYASGGASATYTADDGTTRSYGSAAAGIYIEKGDHITIKGCAIHGNDNGVFGAGQGDNRNLEDVTLDGNRIYGNGTLNSFTEHNTYLEGIDTVYQFNDYGPLRSGALGCALKDRGPGTVIRYNEIEGGGHLIDLVETQNYFMTAMTMASYHQTYVYGNVLYNALSVGASGALVHYGGDQGLAPFLRGGVLHFYDNTVANVADQSQLYKVNVFDLTSGQDALDARDNVICFAPATTGGTASEDDLLTSNATAYLGDNWISPGWTTSKYGTPFTGHLAGVANVLGGGDGTGAGTGPADPGFASLVDRDFRPAAGSPLVDAATGDSAALSADDPPVLFQYADLASGQTRVITGSAPDLGAFEFSS